MTASRTFAVTAVAALAIVLLAGCSRTQENARTTGASSAAPQAGARAASPQSPAPVVAVESFLADVTRQVAGGRFEVRALVPDGVDPHEYEPTPRDVTAVAGARLIVENGGGLESFMTKLIENAGAGKPVAVASSGLTSRTAREGEVLEGGAIATGPSADPDPHFWLNPVNVETYTRNIRDALIGIDPQGKAAYTANADAYIAKLRELDAWIEEQVATIPPAERKLVTNHESFGYFADRYGFRIIG
ncbi:MAG TPA: metal ABC transporter substrate-binding protein, partial [Spirochaetia bacterium]